VIRLTLPGPAERPENIPLLVDHLVAKLNRLQGKNIAGVSGIALARLTEYKYPGNVREFENIIEQAFVLCRSGLVEMKHLQPEFRMKGAPSVCGPMSLEAMDSLLIGEALEQGQP